MLQRIPRYTYASRAINVIPPEQKQEAQHTGAVQCLYPAEGQWEQGPRRRASHRRNFVGRAFKRSFFHKKTNI